MKQRNLFLIIDGGSLLSISFYSTTEAYLIVKVGEDKAYIRRLFGMSCNKTCGLLAVGAAILCNYGPVYSRYNKRKGGR